MKFFVLFLLTITTLFGQNIAQNDDLLIIDELIKKSKNSSNSLDERKNDAIKSVTMAIELDIDSLILKTNRNLSLLYYYSEDFDKYIPLNQENFKLAEKLNDTSALAVSSGNLASYYKYIRLNDSAYFYFTKSLKFYSKLKDPEQESYALMSIADLQYNGKDYTSSEKNAIAAIKILSNLPKNEDNLDDLWILNNRVADISSELNQFDKSIEYHNRALVIAEKMSNGFINRIYSINNKAFVYRQMGRYDEALDLYESLIPLKSKYEEEDPTFYALIINNIAYTQLLRGSKDHNGLLRKFQKAYEIANQYDDRVTKMAISTDLSKFYLKTNKIDSAYKYAKETYDISRNLSSTDYTLDALMTLSKIEKGEDGKKYLNEHIKLSDSLLNIERNERNKFARIEYETDELEAENKQISKENLYLAILSIGLLLTAILIYVVISQRAKNRKLKLVQVQQKANEDIYNLMLGQQDKVDEARAKEKIRVSKELHDGVLGRLFGTRLSLDSMNFKDGKEAMMTRANYIGQLKTIEEDIRKISHELNTDFISGTGFMDIVSELVENQTQAYGLKNDFDYTDDISWDLVSNKTKINIYRIIQESMQNIYKHANAKAIKISISLEKGVICLDIIDDGDGFDTSKSKKGIGLKNMTSRVEDIDGKITFTSQSGDGTKVNVKIPYTNQST
ncbi:tetratricopeptide repeat-containing sensor histidine kinase [Winogradskyella sp.]|uniref:tetratricopeptide repeat-containing sensor histidine kinase n=1 Tax=Winogradskyella sp. TaxID=1883156 RepID=UPI0025E15438|nr:tetratricopeptide repeat-containing sensor histidine kinase [Winogradskyella sp.]